MIWSVLLFIAVDANTWAQVIALYPTLVECITCSSSEVCSALKEALVPFKDFMHPPASKVQNGESWPHKTFFFNFWRKKSIQKCLFPGDVSLRKSLVVSTWQQCWLPFNCTNKSSVIHEYKLYLKGSRVSSSANL